MASASRKLRDQRWVERIREGDRAAFEALFRAYVEKLCAFAERYVRSSETAQDIVQEVFLRVWKRRHSLRAQGSIKSYLYTAVRHQALDHLKHRQVVARHAEQAQALDAQIREQETVASPAPMEHLCHKELSEAIREAIEQLPERRRLVFVLSREHGLTYKEIAHTLGISVSTVETQMRRAFKALRRSLAAHLTPLVP